MKRRLIISTITLFLLVGTLSVAHQGNAQQSGSLADLVAQSLTLDPENPGPGQSVTVRASISNEGAAETNPFFINIRTINIDGQLRTIFSRLVNPGLDPGEELHVSTVWFVDPAVSELRLEVDTNFRVQEFDEENNILSRPVSFAADFVIENVEFSPQFPKPNERASIFITVKNDSNSSTTQNIGVRVSRGRESNYGLAFIQGGLAAGESETIEIVKSSIPAGEQLIRVVVDHTNAFVELDEFNNSFETLINVTPIEPTGADLVVREVLLNPADPDPGDIVTIQAIVENTGSGFATGFDVSLQVDGAEQERASTETLQAGASTPVTFLWQAEAQERILRVKVDPGGLIPEQNEMNNASALTIDARDPLPIGCGHFAWINVNDEALEILSMLTGFDNESVRNVFLPKMRDIMAEQYAGINIRFTFDIARIPSNRGRAIISFTGEDHGNILGQAPIGLIGGTGFVYMGSFNRNLIQSLTLNRQAIVIGTVASHELGHLLGIGHTSENDQLDIMSANAEVSVGTGTIPPQFTPETRERLQRTFPTSCL